MKGKGKKIKTERSKGVVQVIVKVWVLNCFVAHCKSSSIFKSNLGLALLIILKERKLYEWKMFKNDDKLRQYS